MGDAFRRLFLSIGVALGLAAGQPDPCLVARALLVEGPGGERLVSVDARVENAFAPGAIELVEAGTRVAIRYSARLEEEGAAYGASEIRSLRYDLRTGRYVVGFGGGKEAGLVDPQAARGLAAQLTGLELRRSPGSGEPAAGAQLRVEASIGIIDAKGDWHDAPVLWNYRAPQVAVGLGEARDSPGPAAAGGGR